MQVIKSVDVLSCAKIMGAVYGAMGLLAIPILLVVGFASLASGQQTGAMGGIAFVALGLFAPFFYGGLGFVFGGLGAWVYNLAAKWLGGIQIELTETPATSAASIGQVGSV
jgi:hypothetical protein